MGPVKAVVIGSAQIAALAAGISRDGVAMVAGMARGLSGVGAYVSVRYLTRYFQTRTLTPFGIYCLAAGLASIAYLQFVK